MGLMSDLGARLAPRAEKIRKDAIQEIRKDPAYPGLHGREKGILGAGRDVSEYVVTPSRTDAMSDALRAHAGRLAARRIKEMRMTGVEKELPVLHKAQKVTFHEGRMQVHLGSRAGRGSNVVALPNFALGEDRAVEQRRGVQILELDSRKEGGTVITAAGDEVMKNGRGIGVDFVFSEECVNLRESRGRAR